MINERIENEWIAHDGGECPIPWAKSGEFELTLWNGTKLKPEQHSAIDFYWGKDSAYKVISWRLTDKWIPVINLKCYQPFTAEADEWEWRTAGGQITPGGIKLVADSYFTIAVAVRPIKPIKVKLPDCQYLETIIKINNDNTITDTKEFNMDVWLNIKPITNAYFRFRESPRGKEALAQIGKSTVPMHKPLGEDYILELFQDALTDFEIEIQRKKK